MKPAQLSTRAEGGRLKDSKDRRGLEERVQWFRPEMAISKLWGRTRRQARLHMEATKLWVCVL